MTYPSLELRVAFDYDPLNPIEATGGDWTAFDPTTVKALNVVTGKQQAFDDIQPGTLSVTLDNADRTYDPLNPDGPYYGDLRPGKRMQLVATRNGVTYEMFNGFVDSYRLSYAQLQPGDVALAATDALKYLRRHIPGDAISEIVLADNPTSYYRLGETTGQVLLDSSGNGNDAVWTADLKDSTTTGLVGAWDHALKLPDIEAGVYGVIPYTAFREFNGGSIEFWFRAEHPPEPIGDPPYHYANLFYGGGVTASIVDGDSLLAGSLSVSMTDHVYLASADTASSAVQYSICDGRTHFVQIYYDSSQIHIYVDGVDRTAAHFETGAPLGGSGLTGSFIINKKANWNGEVVLDELAFHNSGSPLARAALEMAEWTGDKTGTRIGRILNMIDWPLWTVSVGTTSLGPARWDANTTVMDYLSKVATTEQGRLLVAHWDYGRIEFRDRSWIDTNARSTQVQGTFSDQPTANEYSGLLGSNPTMFGELDDIESPKVRYESLELAYDEANVVRQVTVNWDGGSVTATDPTASATDVIRSVTVDTVIPEEQTARALADWLLARNRELFLRVQSIKVAPNRMKGALADLAWGQVLSLREGDRIRVERQPGGTGAVVGFDCIIEGREHDISEGVERWETTFWCSPADVVSVWILDVTPFDDTVLSF